MGPGRQREELHKAAELVAEVLPRADFARRARTSRFDGIYKWAGEPLGPTGLMVFMVFTSRRGGVGKPGNRWDEQV